MGLTLLVMALPAPALAATITVTNTSNSGSGSLRAAIVAANGTPAADTINFAIPGGGVHTIAPLTALPDITAPVTINGYSQSGASVNTLAVGNNAVLRIVLSGASAPLGIDGLRLATDDSVIRGLVINGWLTTVNGPGGVGIHILAGSEDNAIRGNFIGTNAAGTAAVPNSTGVRLIDAPSNDIGGDAPAARNTISGNSGSAVQIAGPGANGNQVLGNYIGTNAAGMAAIANGSGVVISFDGDENIVGGTTAGARNVISGNAWVGVHIASPENVTNEGTDGNVIQGNYIGLNAQGNAPIGNLTGIYLSGATPLVGNIIGGTTPGAGNTVSGNVGYGIHGFDVAPEDSPNNKIQGNRIGTTPAGDAAIGNGSHGIYLDRDTTVTVGSAVRLRRLATRFRGMEATAYGSTSPISTW